MDGLIEHSKAKKILPVEKFKVPIRCPHCSERWQPEPLKPILMQESFFDEVRVVQKYTKTCEFCGYTYKYYA